ncbi:MAG: response regulator [Pseudomonadota bacterium]
MAKTILIVEDEPNIAEALAFLFEREGYDVRLASDGETGLAAARSDRPAAIVLDVMLPQRNGFELLKALRGDPSVGRTPVMVLTARGQKRDRETAGAVGADVYLTKPFSNRLVVDEMRRLVAP